MHRDLQNGAVPGELHHGPVNLQGIDDDHDVEKQPDHIGEDPQNFLKISGEEVEADYDPDVILAAHAVACPEIDDHHIKHSRELFLRRDPRIEEKPEEHADENKT